MLRINLAVAYTRDTSEFSPSVNALAETGSELTEMPAPILKATGIVRLKKKTFRTASNETLLGVRTLEGFSATVDALGRKLVATATIVA